MSKQQQFDKVGLLGVDIDVITMNEAINYICRLAGRPASPAVYVVKPYVEFLDRAARDPQITQLLNEAELAVADGVALQWSAHYLYAGPHTVGRFLKSLVQIIFEPRELAWPLTERAAGTNFTWPLLEMAAANHLKIFLIGKASSEEISATADFIKRRLPGLQISGSHSGRDPHSPSGRVTEAWLDETAAAIQSAGADIVLVGMGFPLQEQVCAELARRLSHGVFVGEGGTFDYESFGGSRRKAPSAFQRAGLEWLWRLILQPRRLGRQLAIPRYIAAIWRSR